MFQFGVPGHCQLFVCKALLQFRSLSTKKDLIFPQKKKAGRARLQVVEDCAMMKGASAINVMKSKFALCSASPFIKTRRKQTGLVSLEFGLAFDKLNGKVVCNCITLI